MVVIVKILMIVTTSNQKIMLCFVQTTTFYKVELLAFFTSKLKLIFCSSTKQCNEAEVEVESGMKRKDSRKVKQAYLIFVLEYLRKCTFHHWCGLTVFILFLGFLSSDFRGKMHKTFMLLSSSVEQKFLNQYRLLTPRHRLHIYKL